MKHCLGIIKTDSEISQANMSSTNLTVNKNKGIHPNSKTGDFQFDDRSKQFFPPEKNDDIGEAHMKFKR